MKSVTIQDAKENLLQLVEAAANGEETLIAKDGKPLARLVPITESKPQRRFGLLKGQVQIADDFDAPLPDDVLASFEGR